MARGPSLVQAVPIAPELQREAHVGQEVAIPGSDGFAEAGNAIGRELAGVSKTLGRLADHAAQVEGQRAGHLAGMDPEFRPTHLMTIRAEAFDKAGLQTALSRLHVGIVNDVEDAHQKHIANPAELKKVLDAKRAGYLKQAPLDLQPEIVTLFEKTSAAAFRSATRELWARQQADLQGATVAELQTITRRMQQEAFGLGLDQPAEDILNSRFAELKGVLARKGINGQPLIPPATAAKMLEQAKEELTTSRVMGTFGRLPSPEAKAQFLAKLEEEFAKSEGLAKNYDIGTFRQVTSMLRAELNRDLMGAKVAQREITDQIRVVAGWAEKGEAPNQDVIAGIRARIAATAPEMMPALDEATGLLFHSQRLRGMTPEQIDAYVRDLRAGIGEDGQTPRREAFIKLAEGIQGQIHAGIKSDPLGWAEKAGIVDRVTPLDPTDGVSLQRRIVQAEAIAEHFGIRPRYLRPDEDRRLEAEMAKGGQQALTIANILATAAPDRATAILSEIDKKHAGHLGLLGLLVRDRADPTFLTEAANGLALSRLSDRKVAGPIKPEERNQALREILGTGLAIDPRSIAAAATLADFAYESHAQNARPNVFDADAWKRRFRSALGERTIGGTVYGGLAPADRGWIFDDNRVIIPPTIAQRQFSRVLDAVKPEDLGGVFHDAGKPATAAEVRAARLLQVGDGQYRLQTGTDPFGQPQLLVDKSGRPALLDLRKLEPELKRRVPSAFIGGTP